MVSSLSSARILQTLAEEHVPHHESPTYLSNAITAYRQASTLDPASTDIPFNLAMATALAADREYDAAASVRGWQEALSLLTQVARQQEEQMKSQSIRPSDFEKEGEAEVEEQQGHEAEQPVVKSHTTLIVPQTIADTLLESVDILLSLFRREEQADDGLARAQLAQHISATMQNALALLQGQATPDYTARELEVKAALLADHNNPDSSAAAHLLMQEYAAFASQDLGDVERFSAWTDALFDLAAAEPHLWSQAYTNYSELASMLSSPLSAARSLKPQSIAPTLSNAFSRMAWIHLGRSELSQATAFSIKAIEATQSGVTFTPGQGFSRSGSSGNSGRDDWPARSALRDACVGFGRVAWTSKDEAAREQAVRLLQKLKFSQAELRDAVSEAEGDPIWTEAEGQWWLAIVQSTAVEA